MVQELDAGCFQRLLYLHHRVVVSTDRAVQGLHAPDRPDSDAGGLGEILLFPVQQGPGGTQLTVHDQ